MTDNSEEPSGNNFFINWDNRLALMKTWLEIGHPFPDQDSFHDSIWNIWIERIETGQTREENQIQKSYQSSKEQEGQYNDPSFDPDGWASDDYWQTCRLTDSMYAALVVSIYAKMESFLKSIYSTICIEADGNNKENKNTYSFKKLKKKLADDLSFKIEDCEAADTYNAARILNVSYKHFDGQYRPTDIPYTNIQKNILSKWNFLKEQNEIDYSKLPIQDIILDCNRFCNDLLQKTEAALKCKTE